MNTVAAVKGQFRQPASVELIAAMLWDFRVELALLAAAGGAFAALFFGAHVSAPAAGVIVAAATVLLLSVGGIRRALARSLRAAAVRRRWRMAWMRCGWRVSTRAR